MNICIFCESEIDEDAVFCPNCGTRITYGKNSQAKSSNFPQGSTNQQYTANYSTAQHYNNSYNANRYPGSYPVYKQRTTQLTIILVLNYIELSILGFFTILFVEINPLIGILTGLIFGLIFWLIYELQHYNNTARKMVLVLTGLSLIWDMLTFTTSFNFLGVVLAVFTMYVLAVHQPTINLFEENYSARSSPNNYPRYI